MSFSRVQAQARRLQVASILRIWKVRDRRKDVGLRAAQHQLDALRRPRYLEHEGDVVSVAPHFRRDAGLPVEDLAGGHGARGYCKAPAISASRENRAISETCRPTRTVSCDTIRNNLAAPASDSRSASCSPAPLYRPDRGRIASFS